MAIHPIFCGENTIAFHYRIFRAPGGTESLFMARGFDFPSPAPRGVIPRRFRLSRLSFFPVSPFPAAFRFP
jgi:hypothetical protein